MQYILQDKNFWLLWNPHFPFYAWCECLKC